MNSPPKSNFINRITGLPEMHRKGIGHNLNTRAAAMRYAREQGKAYKDITVIVAHLGGGITVNLHHNGRIEDCVNDEEGPFSPERAGGLPMYDVIHRSFEEGQSDKSMMKLVKSRGDLLDHLGTTDCREVEHRIQNGDAHAKLIYDAMALNVAKFIGKTAPGVCGKVDAILLTGGITYSDSIDEEIRRRVYATRHEQKLNTTDNSMDILNKLPRFLSKAAIRFIRWLDRHGWCPDFLIGADPNYASVFLSNLGSIRLRSGYHHLTNWGTCSFFCVIGEKKWTPLYDQNGLVAMRETVDLGFTVVIFA